ncbi:MAG: FtsH protease activity modulator HflK [Phyllobacteriaceae bacterium]|nr:FtsH protease activity modulator HflK [Phyllobacteriaceae bacterium]
MSLPHFGRRGGLLVLGLTIFLWGVSGFYRVQPDEQGIVQRFGKWVATESPGIHYHWPYPVETVMLPKTTQINQLILGRDRNQMLTGDENIVEADCVVFWRIRDAGQYLFDVADPEGTLRVAAESALREVIGQNPIQAALSDKRQQIADQTVVVLQRLLDGYGAGIDVTQVQLLRIDPPSAVIDAFNDVQRARADQERARNEADAYRNDVLPRARGEAEHILQEAEAYREQVVDLAKGDAESFSAVAAAYEKHPAVTARRLYLESVDEVLRHAGRVVVDMSSKSGGVVPYLPLLDPKAERPATAAVPSTGEAK